MCGFAIFVKANAENQLVKNKRGCPMKDSPCCLSVVGGCLLENLLAEENEVVSPVTPYVTSLRLVVDVGVAQLIEFLTQVDILLVEEVLLADTYPEEFRL